MVKENMEKMSKGIRCGYCNHLHCGHTNFYGKICINCGEFIDSEERRIRIKINESKKEEQNNLIRKLMKDRLKNGD